MGNSTVICAITRQIAKCCERAGDLLTAKGTARYGSETLGEVFESMILEEVEHIQILTLELTKEITGQDERHDDDGGTAFGPGELRSTLGPKDDPLKQKGV